MVKKELYTLKGYNREDFNITGYSFGSGEKAACIVGAIRGNEYQQMYICSQLIRVLGELEERGQITANNEILVVPCLNHYSVNVQKRFLVKGYSYGIQFTSFYMQGDFIPHVRMMETGHQSPSLANLFGLPYVVIRKPKPLDTTTLNYNWQMCGTCAFSIYTNCSDYIDDVSARQAVASVLRFLTRMGIIKYYNHSGFIAHVLDEDELMAVKTNTAGLYRRLKSPSDPVYRGDIIGEVIDPYEGEVINQVISPTEGIIFFAHTAPTVMENNVVYRIIRRLHE